VIFFHRPTYLRVLRLIVWGWCRVFRWWRAV